MKDSKGAQTLIISQQNCTVYPHQGPKVRNLWSTGIMWLREVGKIEPYLRDKVWLWWAVRVKRACPWDMRDGFLKVSKTVGEPLRSKTV